MNTQTTLKRSLGVIAIVGLGLGYMTPTVVFDTFGIVSRISNNVVPLAYLVGLLVMLFTAISYGKMVRIYPDAGSAYTYTRRTMGEHLGFLVGWASLLDYLLLPMVNALILRIYMVAIFPEVPSWIWVVAWVAVATIFNIVSMRSTSDFNLILLVYGFIIMVIFFVLGYIQLQNGFGTGQLFTIDPLWHANVEIITVFSAATVVAFSFIGFDAITMYTEEAKDQNTVPRAIILTVLIGGVIFFIFAYLTQQLFPTVEPFEVVDDTLPEIGLYVGGQIFQYVFVSAGFAMSAASGLASHASVSRLLYVMGRNEVLPKKVFGYVSPKFRTPIWTVIITGVVSLLAIGPDLELVASVINFGALIAFTFVNLSVISYYAVKKKRYKQGKDFFNFIIMPVIGAVLTFVLWYHLDSLAFIGGSIWLVIGFVYMLFLTKMFKKPLGAFDEAEAERVFGNKDE